MIRATMIITIVIIRNKENKDTDKEDNNDDSIRQ